MLSGVLLFLNFCCEKYWVGISCLCLTIQHQPHVWADPYKHFNSSRYQIKIFWADCNDEESSPGGSVNWLRPRIYTKQSCISVSCNELRNMTQNLYFFNILETHGLWLHKYFFVNVLQNRSKTSSKRLPGLCFRAMTPKVGWWKAKSWCRTYISRH